MEPITVAFRFDFDPFFSFIPKTFCVRDCFVQHFEPFFSYKKLIVRLLSGGKNVARYFNLVLIFDCDDGYSVDWKAVMEKF